MASKTNTFGCSGCLIEAIERHEERTLRQLLSNANVEYSDIHWVPRDSLLLFKEPFLNTTSEYLACSCPRFPVLSNFFLLNASQHCYHRVVDETLTPGKPENIAMSVVLSSMLYTTAEFNAFKIVVESHKFDMNEPLIFHQRQSSKSWSLGIVSPAGMSLVLVNGTDIEDPNSFLLLKTLKLSFLNREKDLRAIEVRLVNGIQRETAFRVRGALLFLYHRCCAFSRTQPLWLFALLKALCRMGFWFKPHVDPMSLRSLNSSSQGEYPYKYYTCEELSSLWALTSMFDFWSIGTIDGNPYMECYVAHWIRWGWIGTDSDSTDADHMLTEFIQFLVRYPHREANFRIIRQFFALGIFPNVVSHSFDDDEQGFFDYYFDVDDQTKREDAHKSYVSKVLPLQTEFFRSPLSLLQLSRAAIRQQLGMNDFERRVKTLPLPPLLLEYVWRANEILADVAPPEGLESQL